MSNYQYIRTWSVLVVNNLFVVPNQTLDFSNFRIKFAVKRTNYQTPNVADIKIYNVSPETILQIQKNNSRIILEAGYGDDQKGVIFSGNIKQIMIGRESGTDTFVEILASDGNLAYNYALVSTSLIAGTTVQDDITAAIDKMKPLGVKESQNVNIGATQKRPRGKVLHGSSKNYLRTAAQTNNYNWSIQNEQVTFIPITGYLPGEAVEINATNGMIGSPQQTLQGVNVKCLLNPKIQVGTRVKLNNKDIQQLAIDLQNPGTAAGIPAPIPTDGVYFVGVIDFTGDTRGIEWYSTLTLYYIDPSLPPAESVQIGYD